MQNIQSTTFTIILFYLGTDITLVSFSKPVGFCLEAAEILAKEGISAEVYLFL